MTDLVRIFLICCCMVLSFKLGKEYAFRYGIKKALDEVSKMVNEFVNGLKKPEAPSPNETLGDELYH